LNGGPLYADIKNAIFNKLDNIKVINYIYGLGGRDILVSDLENILYELEEINKDSEQIDNYINYYGVRE